MESPVYGISPPIKKAQILSLRPFAITFLINYPKTYLGENNDITLNKDGLPLHQYYPLFLHNMDGENLVHTLN